MRKHITVLPDDVDVLGRIDLQADQEKAPGVVALQRADRFLKSCECSSKVEFLDLTAVSCRASQLRTLIEPCKCEHKVTAGAALGGMA